MRPIVYEPRGSSGGHYFQFVACLLEGMLHYDYRPILVCAAGAPNHPAFASYINDSLLNRIEIIETEHHLAHADIRYFHYQQAIAALNHAIEKTASDWLFIPTGDGILQTMAANPIGRYRIRRQLRGFDALLLNGGAAHAENRVSRWRARASQQLALVAGCTRVHFLDPYAFEWSPPFRPLIATCPEPVEERPSTTHAEARREFGLPADRTVIGVYGSQDHRKGLDLLVDALNASTAPRNAHLLVVGRQGSFAKDVLARLKTSTVGVTLVDDYVSTERLLTGILAADVVALPYRIPSMSSGIFARAAKFGIPVVTTDRGFLGRTTRALGVGEVANIMNPSDFGKALSSQAMHSRASEVKRPNDAVRSYYSITNWQAHWLHDILAADSIDATNELVAWSSLQGTERCQ